MWSQWAWLLVPDGLPGLFQKLLISWDLHGKQTLEFTHNSEKVLLKHCVGERGEREMTTLVETDRKAVEEKSISEYIPCWTCGRWASTAENHNVFYFYQPKTGIWCYSEMDGLCLHWSIYTNYLKQIKPDIFTFATSEFWGTSTQFEHIVFTLSFVIRVFLSFHLMYSWAVSNLHVLLPYYCLAQTFLQSDWSRYPGYCAL